MRVNTENVYDPDGKLMAVIIRQPDEDQDVEPGTHFLTHPSLPLQLAFINHEVGGKVEPHYHPPVERTMAGTPEVLMIVDGEYRLTLYLTDGRKFSSYVLPPGTLVLLLSGGHGLTALSEDGNGILEVKVGPYLGAADKVRYL